MKTIVDKRINERQRCHRMDWPELKNLILQHVRDQLGLDDRASVQLILKQRTEGSPPYTVDQWELTVNTVEKFSVS